MDNIDAVLKLIDERRAIRKKKKAKKKKKRGTTAKAKSTTAISIPMNVSGNDSKARVLLLNRDRTLSIKEQLKDQPETLKTKTSKNRPKSPDALEELTSRASKGSLALIYALQKDVKDLAKKITQPIQQSTIPYGQRGTDRFDIQSGIQRAIAEEKKKLKIGKESVNIDLDVIDLDDGLGNTRKVKQTKSTIPVRKRPIVISPFTQPQGIREVALDMMNAPDIGAGGGMDTLPIPLLPVPSWRSTIDTYERPKLREVLAEPPAEIPYYGDETIAEIPLEGEMDGGILDDTMGTIAELPDEGQDSQDFGDGGGGGDEDVAEEEVAPPKKGRKIIISDEPPIVVNTGSGKKKGRPAGSKNKPKPETNPDKIAIIGSPALKGGGGARGKTPANSPMI
jgi:hypothetical protein